jgi:hypothetical protein
MIWEDDHEWWVHTNLGGRTVRIASSSNEIQTVFLLNTNLELYIYTILHISIFMKNYHKYIPSMHKSIQTVYNHHYVPGLLSIQRHNEKHTEGLTKIWQIYKCVFYNMEQRKFYSIFCLIPDTAELHIKFNCLYSSYIKCKYWKLSVNNNVTL